MASIKSLKVGQTMEIQTDEGETLKGKIKRVKDTLIAVSVVSGLKNRAGLRVGTVLRFNMDGKGEDLLPAVVRQDKAFPLLILSASAGSRNLSEEEQNLEEEDAEDLLESLNDPNYVNMRDSARSEDSFPIEFYKQSQERAALKKNEYLVRPSSQRRETARQDGSGGGAFVDESELRRRMAHLDPVLQDIIVDLYHRTSHADASAEGTQKTSQVRDENIGICVDISGTGLRLLTSQPLQSGDILKVMIEPPLARPPFSVSALVEVRRVSRLRNPDPPHKKYAVGVRYYAMHEEDMEQITAYTFKLQRDQLKLKRQLKTG